MSARKKGLGRGLDALLGGGDDAAPTRADETAAGDAPSAPSQLPVDQICRGRFQPRRRFDDESLQELAASISAQGVVQPVVVRPLDADRYELIAGERRWRAAQLAGLDEIPAVVRVADDQAVMAMGLIENIQRADLNPLEEAEALQRLLSEFELTHQQVADAVGKSRAAVSNLVRLLDLNPEVKALVDDGQLEMGHARALLGLSGDAQTEAAGRVVRKGLSVRETEALVRKLSDTASKNSSAGAPIRTQDPDVRRLEAELADRLGARVQLQQRAGGKGRLIIDYHSLDELDGIIAHIQ